MKKSTMGFVVTLLAIVVSTGLIVTRQWSETVALRAELVLARMETAVLDQLRAENVRLLAAQTPAGEVEQLRADHAALPRLRAELDALNRKAAHR